MLALVLTTLVALQDCPPAYRNTGGEDECVQWARVAHDALENCKTIKRNVCDCDSGFFFLPVLWQTRRRRHGKIIHPNHVSLSVDD